MDPNYTFGGPFPNVGAGPPAAAFAFNGSNGLIALGLPAGWTLTTGPALDDPFGQYAHYLSGPSVPNGTLTNTLSSLTFYVANQNGSAFTSANQLIQSNNHWPSPCGGPAGACNGFYFALHAYGQNSYGTFDSQVGAITQ
jgi:hypothetical protein